MERINSLFQLKAIVHTWAREYGIRIERIEWENVRVATITLSSCQILWSEPIRGLEEHFKHIGVDAVGGAARIILIFSD